MTISVDQLCKKLKKINPHFSYSIINDNDEWLPEHDTDTLSSMKQQVKFCEQNIAEFLLWQKEDGATSAEAAQSDKASV